MSGSQLLEWRRAWVAHMTACEECTAAALDIHASRCARGEGIRRAATALGLFQYARIEQARRRASR